MLPALLTFHQLDTAPEFTDRRPVGGWRLGTPLTVAAWLALAACSGERTVLRDGTTLPPSRLASATDLAEGTVPRMLNVEPPFRYPAELYERQVQGNVTLRLHVDSTGRVRPESTTIVTPSGYPSLDSAAVQGAVALRFAPALRDGRPVGKSIRFPVLFRHPAAPPLPGDTVLKR